MQEPSITTIVLSIIQVTKNSQDTILLKLHWAGQRCRWNIYAFAQIQEGSWQGCIQDFFCGAWEMMVGLLKGSKDCPLAFSGWRSQKALKTPRPPLFQHCFRVSSCGK